MVLEQHFNQERIDIRSLSLDIPDRGRRVPFDPERDISNWDKETLLAKLESMLNGTYHPAFKVSEGTAEMCKSISILFPEEFKKLSHKKEAWLETFENFIDDYLPNNASWSEAVVVKTVASLGEAFPARFRKEDEIWEFVKHLYSRKALGEKTAGEVLPQVACVKTVFPKKLRQLISVDQEDEIWNHARPFLKAWRKDEKWDLFAATAADMRTIFPDRFSKIMISQTDWSGMKNLLAGIPRGDSIINWLHFYSKMAANMKILAAEEVEITEKGLKVTMPNAKFPEQESQIPQKRKF